MGLGLAIKSFFRALREKEEAREFLRGGLKEDHKEMEDRSHLRLLYLLQNSGRLLDFFQEDLSEFTDAQVGAVARGVHKECRKSLENYVTVRSLFEEKEGSSVTVPRGYNPLEVKIVGKVKGEAPFEGVLRHKGWKAHKLSLPQRAGEASSEVLAQAEVEVQ